MIINQYRSSKQRDDKKKKNLLKILNFERALEQIFDVLTFEHLFKIFTNGVPVNKKIKIMASDYILLENGGTYLMLAAGLWRTTGP